MNQFISSITINQGQVTHVVFSPIAPADLPLSGVTPGGYTSPNLVIDQFGRITSATNGAEAGGTVTTLSVVTANGVSGTVANPTTTPAITIVLGAITPASVAASGTVTASNLSGSSSGTNTGDQTSVSGSSGSCTGNAATATTAAACSGNAATVTTNANLTGNVTSVGNATTIAAGVVTNAMLAGSIAASNLVGTDIATVGTVTSGVWQGALRGYIDGLILSNDAGTPNTVLDIAAGFCADSTGAFGMVLAAFTKNCNASWASGTGNGGNFLNTTLAASSWYHVFVIRKTSDGSIDCGIDSSVTAANIPSGYVAYRRIGSIRTDGSNHILAFHQYGDDFWWDTSVLDVNANPASSSAVTRTLTVPTGVKVLAYIGSSCFSSTVATQHYMSSLDSVDLAVNEPAGIESAATSGLATSSNAEGFGESHLWTNTSAQLRSRLGNASNTLVLIVRTRGWLDPRGKNS